MSVMKRDEAPFLLLWSSGYIGAKIGLPLAGTFTLLFLRYALVILVVAIVVSLRRESQRPDSGTFLTGFLAHFVWLVAILRLLNLALALGRRP